MRTVEHHKFKTCQKQKLSGKRCNTWKAQCAAGARRGTSPMILRLVSRTQHTLCFAQSEKVEHPLGLPRTKATNQRTEAESQWIVATRPLCHVQYLVRKSGRLRAIHRAGSGKGDRSRLMRYVCARLPPRGRELSFRHGF